ncbi:hypothetical protein DRJ48_01225 [Candidatus Woesearchaeota archaeon]|nr:glycosyltransferase [Candidatus Woesearchaeota archaeon]RLE43328.1 MAG: hypothetical protein DRJ48_01225 [Candidatus Woesearchaeota archaeon]
MEDTTVIIPTLNEEGNISRLLHGLLEHYPGLRIIVVDDGSTDRTQEIVKGLATKHPSIMLIDRSRKRVKGLTASVVDAVSKVTTPKVIVMDADFQHPLEKLKPISKALARYDVVIATRTSTKGWNVWRKLISFGGALLANLRLLLTMKRPVKDPMSGFFGIKTELFKATIRAHKRGYMLEGFKVLFDTLKYLPRGTKIGTVGYKFGLRTAGESKISKKHITYLLKSLVK